MVQLASDILTFRDSLKTDLNDIDENGLTEILKISTSAGGARAKALIALNPKTMEVRTGFAC